MNRILNIFPPLLLLILIYPTECLSQEPATAKYDYTIFYTKNNSVYLSVLKLKDSICVDKNNLAEHGTVSGYVMLRNGLDYFSGDTINNDYDMFRHPVIYIPEKCYQIDVTDGHYSIDLEKGIYTFIVTFYYTFPLVYKVNVNNGWEYVYDNYLGSCKIH